MFHPNELVHWLQTRTNRRLGSGVAEAEFWSLYAEWGVVLRQEPPSITRATAAPCDLLVVLTTYERSELCLRKLQTLPSLLGACPDKLNVHVLVLCDASREDYSTCKRAGRELFGERFTFLEAKERLGKAGYWKAYQVAFLAAKALRPVHTQFLQDDVQYTADMLKDAYQLWAETAADEQRRVLYLFSSEDDEPEGRWIRFRRQVCKGLDLRLTQWFDLQAYLVDLRFFEQLDYRMVPVSPNRWRRRPSLSSGVGAQLTRRLFGQCSVYQAMPPLVLHGAHQSQMNPEARAVRSLDNLGMARRFVQPVIC